MWDSGSTPARVSWAVSIVCTASRNTERASLAKPPERVLRSSTAMAGAHATMNLRPELQQRASRYQQVPLLWVTNPSRLSEGERATTTHLFSLGGHRLERFFGSHISRWRRARTSF